MASRLLMVCAFATAALFALDASAEYSFRLPVKGLTAASTAPSSASVATAASCLQYFQANPGASSGAYPLQIGGRSVIAYCDMTTTGGGWTMVAKNGNDSDWSGVPGESDITDLASPSLTGSTIAKFSDAEINALGYSAMNVVFTSTGRTSSNYISGQCAFSLAAPIAVPGPCAVVYSDAGLTTAVFTDSAYSSSALGMPTYLAGHQGVVSPMPSTSGHPATVVIYVR